jgi:hypothetical protein
MKRKFGLGREGAFDCALATEVAAMLPSMDRRVIPAPVAGSSNLVFDGILFYASFRRGSYPDTVADRST